jgi:hypothetical protein
MTDVSGVGKVSPFLKPGQQQGNEPVPREGRGVGGKVPTFFKALGNVLKKPFVALSKAVSNLKAPPPQVRTEGMKPETKVALDKLNTLYRAQAAGQDVDVAEIKAAKAEVRKLFKEELSGSLLMQLARDDPKNNVLSNEQKQFIIDNPAEGIMSSLAFLLDSPDKLAKIQEFGLSVTEAISIYMYTRGSYEGINREVRTGNESPLVTEMRQLIEGGLSKMPPIDQPIFRAAHLPPTVESRYQEGRRVSDPGIMSTTFEGEYDFSNGSASHYMSMIPKEGSSGRDVSWLSESPHEKEVVFPPGTKFKVLHRESEGEGCPKPIQHDDLGGVVQYDFQVKMILKEV